MQELYPQLKALTLQARSYDIGINIDAEEADRLELSLDLLEKLCFEPELEGWNGIGFVIQAYQKRCPFVIDYLTDLASRSRRRLMIRLVKGAYWDSEIKRAQLDGLEGYPVYTRKVHTDVSYLACARKLLAAPNLIYPQFATHNAHTLAAIYQLAGNNYYPGQYEFQCLHGMGEPLYEQVVGSSADGKLNRPCRIYAPVGTHETLLAYLVRRLLENGANTSFVNRVSDKKMSLEALILDPVKAIEIQGQEEGTTGLPHPRIPLPIAMYGTSRPNSAGIDMANEHRLASLSSALLSSATNARLAKPMPAVENPASPLIPIRNPALLADIVGHVVHANEEQVEQALQASIDAYPIWFATPPVERAAILNRAAMLMESKIQLLMGILVREAGKTYNNAIAEVREAVDFLRYYAYQIEQSFDNDSHRPLGIVVCISPWNFPLAIFTGQVAAALATGNAVIAKPAEQTPLVASEAIQIFYDAGIPEAVLHFLPGSGESVGAQLVADRRVSGVMFTGSTPVAASIQRVLAKRLDSRGRTIPLIAETGGINAMIVDSSALTEQVVVDIMASAFDSAGQRCSALRLLCVQEDVADHTLTMLKGAMAEYRLGNPEFLATDIGPVIDVEARDMIEQHIVAMNNRGLKITGCAFSDNNPTDLLQQGTYVKPTLIELNEVEELQKEIFGPVLHVVRYRSAELPQLVAKINQLGYGLTFGVHTRIDETIHTVVDKVAAGNLYVNRNMVGAVVGVQPFGGEGLSGTGPKAGGPLYLLRLLTSRPAHAARDYLTTSSGSLNAIPASEAVIQARKEFIQWLTNHDAELLTLVSQYEQDTISLQTAELIGPTGESNRYQLTPRCAILCLANLQHDRLIQLAAILTVGNKAIWPDEDSYRNLYKILPPAVAARIELHNDVMDAEFDGVIFHGDADKLQAIAQSVAARNGPIASIQGFSHGETDLQLERLLIERSISVNTAAAGGNASLMTIG
jgi:RHH-type transcriptional regulator, proline utilization regulon repressor / proline dehydrogenase / delta 1-pyrroline-5-carboxylate dehydrogenase